MKRNLSKNNLFTKILESLEKGLRKLFRLGFQKKKKEKYILLKIEIFELLEMLFRLIFYFLLILGGYILTILIPILKPHIFFAYAIFIILTIIMYEKLDDFFKIEIERLRKKSNKIYGPDYNKKIV